MKFAKKVDRFFICILGVFMLGVLCYAGILFLNKLANWENEKYMYDGEIYSEKEVMEYFEKHKEELNQIAEMVVSKSKFMDNGQLEIGISIIRYVEFFHRHKYVVIEYQYPKEPEKMKREIGEYKNDYFTKEEIEVLNNLTDYYCNQITLYQPYFSDESRRRPPYLRFILRSSNFTKDQELIYMPDGSEYRADAGDATHLEGNWYYHRNTLI